MAEVTQDLTNTDTAKQVEMLTQAITFALLTGTEHVYPIPVHEVAKMADLLYRCGLRQTPERDPDLTIELPGWILAGTREAQQEAPLTPDVTAPQAGRVRTAPKCPSKIAKKHIGVVIDE